MRHRGGGIRCALRGEGAPVFFDVGRGTRRGVGLVHLERRDSIGGRSASVFGRAADPFGGVSSPDPRSFGRHFVGIATVFPVSCRLSCSFKTFQVQVVIAFGGSPASASTVALRCFTVLPSPAILTKLKGRKCEKKCHQHIFKKKKKKLVLLKLKLLEALKIYYTGIYSNH